MYYLFAIFSRLSLHTLKYEVMYNKIIHTIMSLKKIEMYHKVNLLNLCIFPLHNITVPTSRKVMKILQNVHLENGNPYLTRQSVLEANLITVFNPLMKTATFYTLSLSCLPFHPHLLGDVKDLVFLMRRLFLF